MDTRDTKVYKVRKLADGNCWMVDNLALESSQTLDDTTSDLNDITTYTMGAVGDPNGQTYCADLNTADYANKCGYQYTWTVATAGSTVNFGSAPNSICPKNWRLPTSEGYTTLSTALGWATGGADSVNNSAWRGLYAGQNTSTNVGSSGYYWMSTSTTAVAAYLLAYDYSSNNNNINPNTLGSRSNQNSVRCLAR
jgi:uncharacterized protein (TIGR02145 family)